MELFNSSPGLTVDDIVVVVKNPNIPHGNQYMGISKIDADQRNRLLNCLKTSDSALKCLTAMGEYGITRIDDKLIQFIKCNFGELDAVDDITADNALNFEYVNCGFKGNNHCPWSKKFCVRKTKIS